MALTCSDPIDDGAKVTCRLQVKDRGAVDYDGFAGVDNLEGTPSELPKRSYGVELRDRAGDQVSAGLVGMGGDGDWILDGAETDRSLMRSALVFDSFREMGHYAPDGRFCTLTLDGVAQGIYRLVETIKRDDDRLDLAADDGSGKSFILKQEKGGGFWLGEDEWGLVYPRGTGATVTQTVAAQVWLDELAAAINGPTPDDPARGVFAYLDLAATADWILIQEFSKNINAYVSDLHVAREGGRPARLVPWRVDLSFGQPTVADDVGDPKNESSAGWISQRPALIQALASVPALTSRLGQRWRALRAGPLSTAAVLARLDGYGVTLTAEAIAQHFQIWSIRAQPKDAGSDAAADAVTDTADADVDAAAPDDGQQADAGAPDADSDAQTANGPLASGGSDRPDSGLVNDAGAPDGAGPDTSGPDGGKARSRYSFYDVADHAEEVARLRAFIEARLDWIDAHIDQYPR